MSDTRSGDRGVREFDRLCVGRRTMSAARSAGSPSTPEAVEGLLKHQWRVPQDVR
jgi:hypothetical protein